MERANLAGIFAQVDRNQNGQISAEELQHALMNGRGTPFNLETVRLLISMFGSNQAGTIGFPEFLRLWNYIADWQTIFRRFDLDNNSFIDNDELKNVLTSFGYRFSEGFYAMLIQRFDRSHRGTIAFDDFIECCVMLEKLTNAFRKHDRAQSGWITIPYEEFLTMVFSARSAQ